MLKYYRFWIVLEGLAARHNYSAEPMRDWFGQIITDKKNSVVLVGKQALNIVFELVRRHFSQNYTSDTFVQELPNIKTPKEFLSVCFQRRCCCAHFGTCNQYDSSICVPSNSAMNLCKRNNTIDSNQPLGFRDPILRKLQDITFQIVSNELKSLAGSPDCTTDLIDKFTS